VFAIIRYLCPASFSGQDDPAAADSKSVGYSALNSVENAALSAVIQNTLSASGCGEALLQVSKRLEEGYAYDIHADLSHVAADAANPALSPASASGPENGSAWSAGGLDEVGDVDVGERLGNGDAGAGGGDVGVGDTGDTISDLISNFYGHKADINNNYSNSSNRGIPPPGGKPSICSGSGPRNFSAQRQKAIAKNRLMQLSRQHQIECRLGIHRTQWCEMCLTAVMKLYIWLLKSNPAALGVSTTVGASGGAAGKATAAADTFSTSAASASASASATGALGDASLPTVNQGQQHQLTFQMGISLLNSLCWQRKILGLVSLTQLMHIQDLQTSGTNGTGVAAGVGGADNRARSRSSAGSNSGSASMSAGTGATKEAGAAKGRKGPAANPATTITSNSASAASKVAKSKSKDDGNTPSAAASGSGFGTNSSSAANNINAIRRQRNQNNALSIRPVEELCKGGHIRALCWNLLNKRGQIRLYAAELLQLIMLQAEREETGTLVWAAFVEQGLVPLLEIVASGLPVAVPFEPEAVDFDAGLHNKKNGSGSGSGSGNLFPENNVRRISHDMLLCLASHLHHSQKHTTQVSMPTTAFLLLQQRLSSALLHSGNKTLRINIFVGMMYLLGRHASLGRSLWVMVGSQLGQSVPGLSTDVSAGAGRKSGAASENGEVFKEMITASSKDKSELTPILETIAHIVHAAAVFCKQRTAAAGAERQQASAVAVAHTNANAAAASVGSAFSNRLQSGCTVLVSNAGQLTRMRCPAVAVIRYHCPPLALILEKSEESAEAFALQAQQSDDMEMGNTGNGKQSSSSSSSSSSLPILAGDYALWQEIFSHMLDLEGDNNLCGPSFQRMSTSMVVCAFHIARRFHMQFLLNKYATVLCTRISTETLVSILAASLGIEEDEKTGAKRYLSKLDSNKSGISYMEPSLFATDSTISVNLNVQLRMHAQLCSACLAYFAKNLDRLFFGGLLSTSAAASSRQHQALAGNFVRQMELLELLHGVLGVMFGGSIAGSAFM